MVDLAKVRVAGSNPVVRLLGKARSDLALFHLVVGLGKARQNTK